MSEMKMFLCLFTCSLFKQKYGLTS